MAQTQEEEIVLGTASPVTSDHKRKHDDLESDSLPLAPELNGNSEPDSVRKIDEVEDDSEAKRQRLDDKDDVSGSFLEFLGFVNSLFLGFVDSLCHYRPVK